ncbi:Sbcb [Buchnera aphidicola str. G002 (Myzus persicae)]|uniref:Exodeoxyribonuclease I n=1 Tax=Buchnera aphidicola str. USDA (Myzus persicae) TaxID=1009856 RepID=W0NZF6_BUCMP|nr:exodeoxyribonuclease I [Buchnera aphidicola]AHG59849.1 Sbcb [Buchnera aphidicola str. USDA (Myzus persicae)]AHG60429.1 Sbcb [Buchnera aphidicola str. W106 (Myzus persicae)]AHG61002.1 Sbcb [Buchnera aphidicola str. G002 (Myzus persicae)]WAI02912.1 MAG: exodeoxyribonuclease I [Buchnera aphidicola (Myzus persicae)]
MILSKKNKPTFLFYDYETFGLNPASDKPAQFACIRTDINLNIIEQPKCFYCYPSDDYLPDPHSILITHITPQYTQKYGTNEYNFSKKIHDILTVSNTCIVGYNNISFDDEITRNIFYRNFFDPYEWSWKNGNSRWDLLNLIRACYALRPNGIRWPKNELGLTSFKLSDLTSANNLRHLNAHDAMSDVYATIEIAKLIKKTQPKLFDFFLKNRKKNQLYKLIDVNTFKSIIYVSGCFGSIRKNMSCILPITWHKNNRNILIALDLFKDIEKLILFLKNISYSQNNIKNLFDLGIVLLYLNRCPILAPIQAIREKDQKRLKFDRQLHNNRIEFVKNNRQFIKNIQIIFSQENYDKNFLDVDLQLYNSFFNLHDKKNIKKIRDSEPIFLEKIYFDFQDFRLKTLFFRYRARNFFHTLNRNEKKTWLKHCLQILEPDALQKYKNKISDLLKEYSSDLEKVLLLNNLLDYVFQKYQYLVHEEINLR